MWEAIKAFFLAWTSANRVAEKALPSEKIQEAKFEQAKPRLEAKEKEKILKNAFKYLKNREDLDVSIYVKYTLDHLPEDDQNELIILLNSQVKEYRKAHPIIFKKWLKDNP